MTGRSKSQKYIYAFISPAFFLAGGFLCCEPIYLIFGSIAAFFSAFGLRGLQELAETPVTKESSASLNISATVSLFLISVSGSVIFMGLSRQLPALLSPVKLISLLIIAFLLAGSVVFFYGTLYDSQGFSTSVIPAIAFQLSGCCFLFVSTHYIPILLSCFLILTGQFCAVSVIGSLLNNYTPIHYRIHFALLRALAVMLAPVAAFFLLKINLFNGTNVFLLAVALDVAVFISLSAVYVVIRTSHFSLSTESGDLTAPRILREFVDPSEAPVTWTEYPRPQMRRNDWINLNGVWKLNTDTIYVPFPPQSSLGCHKGTVSNVLFYSRTFHIPAEWEGERILLHFGAVDQTCEVYVNNRHIGSHEGGYLPFTFDITDSLNFLFENTVEVRVLDLLSKKYPYGKQRIPRGGMWYTPVSGIWQTVWLEPVPKDHIRRIKITPDLKGIYLKTVVSSPDVIGRFTVDINLPGGEHFHRDYSEPRQYIDLEEAYLSVGLMEPLRLWSPESPYLYRMKVTYESDEIETYFGLRTIELKNIKGIERVVLNGNPIYIHGVLDQGYFPEGIFTPAVAKEYARDIMRMKELGFNCLRKHIKIEPDIFYYYCDTLGMLVLQDMVNNGKYSFIMDTIMPNITTKHSSDVGKCHSKKRKEFFIEHCKATLRQLHNHPSIIAYTIFNEGWGQFDSDSIFDILKEKDGTRLYDSTSGWFVQKKSDFDSRHQYFNNVLFTPGVRPLLISECGGFSYMIPEHYFSKYNHFSYGISRSAKELTGLVRKMYDEMVIPIIEKGGCGCIYTQLSDIEDETNGLYTYDRKVLKVDKDEMLRIRDDIEEHLKNAVE
ncbi:MAG: hypothetical protein IJS80_04520 [Lachnospiraceae bacterium]|nr:hypothetical protein [Lachnospiraceae bacterium]